MPSASRHVNENFVLKWNGTDITDDWTSVTWNASVNMIDASAGTDQDVVYIPGRRDNTITVSFADVGTAATAGGGTVSRLIYAGNTGTLEFAPFGTATGKPKYAAVVVVESTDKTHTSYELATYEASLRMDRNGGGWASNYELSGTTY